MIKYKLDYDKALSLENNDGLIIKYGVWISESIQPTWWKGKASENNSRTVLRIPMYNGDEINTVIGELVYNRMYCKLINEAF